MRGLTEALAMLLTDPELRALFAADPATAADSLDLAPEERAAFLALSSAAVELQAQCLLDKRAHEARVLIPGSAAMLGLRYSALFGAYATTAWPAGNRRHWQDAAGFLAFLRDRGERFDPAEARRIAFHIGRRRMTIHLIRRYPTRFGARPAIQILWRRGDYIREVALHSAV